MRSVSRLLLCAVAALLLAAPLTVSRAADFGTPAANEQDQAPVTLREALSRYLSLEMIRTTFDVVEPGDLAGLVEQQAREWGYTPPSAAALADLDRQLLAEGSYYIVSLSYLVQAGGAVFPGDKSEMVYTNDTIAKLDDLQRELADTIAAGGDVLPILLETERFRALTEGYTDVPKDLGVFTTHETLLNEIVEEIEGSTPPLRVSAPAARVGT